MNHKTWFSLLVSAAVLMVLVGSVAAQGRTPPDVGRIASGISIYNAGALTLNSSTVSVNTTSFDDGLATYDIDASAPAIVVVIAERRWWLSRPSTTQASADVRQPVVQQA